MEAGTSLLFESLSGFQATLFRHLGIPRAARPLSTALRHGLAPVCTQTTPQHAEPLPAFRSGRYLYKPVMEQTCCPLYTIRLDAPDFRPSRSQKRVLKVWRDFLQHDKRPKERVHGANHSVDAQPGRSYAGPRRAKKPTPRRTTERLEAGQKAREVRRWRAELRLKEKGVDLEQVSILQSGLFSFFSDSITCSAHRTSYLLNFGFSTKWSARPRRKRVAGHSSLSSSNGAPTSSTHCR